MAPMRYPKETKIKIGVVANGRSKIYHRLQILVRNAGGTVTIGWLAILASSARLEKGPRYFGKSREVREGEWLAFVHGYVREALDPSPSKGTPRYFEIAQ